MSNKYIKSMNVDIVHDYPSLSPYYEMAWKDYGVQLGYFAYNSGYPDRQPKSGIYAVICPDLTTLNQIQCNYINMEDVLIDNYQKAKNEVPLYYNAIYLSDINPSNEYEKVRSIEKAIQNVSTAKYAFQEYGYDLPRSVTQITLDKFARYNNIRHAGDLTQDVRNEYEGVMERTVAQANVLYNKDTDWSRREPKPVRSYKEQLLDKDYFLKNHCITVNDVVSDDFWKYLQEHLPEKPEFRIYKDRKPSLVLKDNSSDKNVLGINIWAAQKDYREYNVSFTKGQENTFYTFLLDYRSKGCKSLLKENKIAQYSEQPLQMVKVPLDDLQKFDAYCAANLIKYSINHGLFGDNTTGDVQNIKVGVRTEDRDKVNGILLRIAQEELSPVYVNKDRERIDKMQRKCIDNPYLRQIGLPSRVDSLGH